MESLGYPTAREKFSRKTPDAARRLAGNGTRVALCIRRGIDFSVILARVPRVLRTQQWTDNHLAFTLKPAKNYI